MQFSYALTVAKKNADIFESNIRMLVVLFCCLRPKSTAMVMAGGSVHLTTLFPGQA